MARDNRAIVAVASNDRPTTKSAISRSDSRRDLTLRSTTGSQARQVSSGQPVEIEPPVIVNRNPPVAQESQRVVPVERTTRTGPNQSAIQFTDRPDSFWIVSSRDARGAPGADESSLELQYMHRTPGGMASFSRETLLGSLRPDRPTCIVIHGSYNYWPDVMSESLKSFRWVKQAAQGQDVQFVFFTWPSNGYVPVVFPVELAVLGRRCAIHSLYLANLISHMPADQPVCLMGHSHGSRCVVAALHALGGGAVDDGSRLPPGSPVPTRVRAVLLAAAVDHDWLNPGERYGFALDPVERMLVMTNPRDGWLGVYPIKNLMGNAQALGYRGLQFEDQMRLQDRANKITLLDASGIAGASHDFAEFHSRAEFASAIRPFVMFDDDQDGTVIPGEGDVPRSSINKTKTPSGPSPSIQQASQSPTRDLSQVTRTRTQKTTNPDRLSKGTPSSDGNRMQRAEPATRGTSQYDRANRPTPRERMAARRNAAQRGLVPALDEIDEPRDPRAQSPHRSSMSRDRSATYSDRNGVRGINQTRAKSEPIDVVQPSALNRAGDNLQAPSPSRRKLASESVQSTDRLSGKAANTSHSQSGLSTRNMSNRDRRETQQSERSATSGNSRQQSGDSSEINRPRLVLPLHRDDEELALESSADSDLPSSESVIESAE